MVSLPVLPAPAAAKPASPSSSLWYLGVEAQELTHRIGALAELLDSEESEIQAEAVRRIEEALAAEAENRLALEAKADATCWVIENLRAHADYRKHQAKRLTELAARDGQRAERLETVLLTVLTCLQPGATRFSLPNHELTSRRSQALVLEEGEALDPEWLTLKTTAQPDKAAIKAALKAGRVIEGAQLVERRSWRIT